jgi:hypothetical protein
MIETDRSENTLDINPLHCGAVRSFTGFDSVLAGSLVRIGFWITAVALGGLLTYTAGYFLSNDGRANIEIADAFRAGRWEAMLNLAFSRGFPELLAVERLQLGTALVNELLLSKVLNLLSFILSLTACEVLVVFVLKEWNRTAVAGERVSPWPVMNPACYVLFPVIALVSVKVDLMNLDVLVFAILFLSMFIILWVRENSRGYGKYICLGIAVSTGYFAEVFLYWVAAPLPVPRDVGSLVFLPLF